MASVIIGAIVQIWTMNSRCKEDEKMVRNAPKRSFTNEVYVYEFLACMVAGVYARDRDLKDAENHWTQFGYEEVNPRTQLQLNSRADSVSSELERDDAKKYARLMLFRKTGDEPRKRLLRENTGASQNNYEEVQWPMWVVAVRGTIFDRRDDLRDDLGILSDTLGDVEELYEPMEELLLGICKGYGAGNVWVAGHSLGGYLMLRTTRQLAIDEEILLEAHLFNPPNISYDVGLKRLFTGSVNGWAKGVEAVLPSFLGRAIRRNGAVVAHTCESALRRIFKSVSKFVSTDAFADATKRFNLLQKVGFSPHLYVNPKDPICSEFIEHFKGDPPPSVSNVVSFTKLFNKYTESCHLIPQAYLHINHWGKGPYEAHKLHQWFQYDTVNLTSELAGRR